MDNDWWSALCYAVWEWDWDEVYAKEIAKRLIYEWASLDVRYQSDKRTVLMEIVEKDDAELVTYAMDEWKYSDIDLKDNDGWTALCYALWKAWEDWEVNIEIAQALINAWASLNIRYWSDKRTVLMEIASKNLPELMAYALSEWSWVDLELKDNDWWTALCYAVWEWDWDEVYASEVAKILIKDWANLNVRYQNDKRTVLMEIVDVWDNELLKEALTEWVWIDLELKDNDWWTALCFAAWKDEEINEEAVKLLIEEWANLNVRYQNDKSTIFMHIIESWSADLIKYAMENWNPNLKLKNDNWNSVYDYAKGDTNKLSVLKQG